MPEVEALYVKGVPSPQIAVELDLTAAQVANRIKIVRTKLTAKAETPEIDMALLPMSMQQKCEAWKRQTEKRLRIEIAEEERLKVRKWWNEDLFPHYNKELTNAKAIEKARKGVFTGPVYRRLLAALHPDRSVSTESLHELFILFKAKEMVLLSEKELQVASGWSLPKTYEEWMERRRQTTAARQAKRASRSGIQTK